LIHYIYTIKKLGLRIYQINLFKSKISSNPQIINNILVSKNILKKLHSRINEDAYYHRDLVDKTWTNTYFDENKIHIDLNDSFYREIKDFYINDEIDKIKHLLNEILIQPCTRKFSSGSE